MISVIASKKRFFISTVTVHRCTGQCKETGDCKLVIHFLSFFHPVQITVNNMPDTVCLKYRTRDELRILQIYLILFIIIVVGKFRITGDGQVFSHADALVTFRCQTSYV